MYVKIQTILIKKYLIRSGIVFIALFSLSSLKIDTKEAKIGNQTWTNSNLNVSKFRNTRRRKTKAVG